MSFIGFIKDENGNYYSEDRKVRYIMLEGEELYKFLKSIKNQSRYFHIEIDEDGNRYAFETDLHTFLKLRKEQNHTNYLLGLESEFGYEIVSANYVYEEALKETELIETFRYDGEVCAEDVVIKMMLIEALRVALKQLSKDEYFLISKIYLSENRLSETQCAKMLGVTQQAISKKLSRIKNKLKIFLESWL